MKNLLKKVLDFLDTERARKAKDDAFLAESTDLVDLERRIKILENRRTHSNVFNNIHHF